MVRSKEEYSAFKEPILLIVGPWTLMLLDGEVPTDLTASEIEVSLIIMEYIIQKFFATLIRNPDCKYFFNSGRHSDEIKFHLLN